MYDYFLYIASMLPLRSTRVCRQYSPLSLLCITMILRVRRKFFEITMFPYRNNISKIICFNINICSQVHLLVYVNTSILLCSRHQAMSSHRTTIEKTKNGLGSIVARYRVSPVGFDTLWLQLFGFLLASGTHSILDNIPQPIPSTT